MEKEKNGEHFSRRCIQILTNCYSERSEESLCSVKLKKCSASLSMKNTAYFTYQAFKTN
jgi:hypothetical protein